MAYPADTGRKMWRNNLTEVASFLNTYHRNNYMIFNLTTEKQYDVGTFYGRVRGSPVSPSSHGSSADVGFPDHHPAPLAQLDAIVNELAEFLKTGGTARLFSGGVCLQAPAQDVFPVSFCYPPPPPTFPLLFWKLCLTSLKGLWWCTVELAALAPAWLLQRCSFALAWPTHQPRH